MTASDRRFLKIRRACRAACFGLALLPATDAMAQAPASARPSTPPANPAQPNPAIAAAQAAFDRLPEPERKAIQTDLVWTGDLNSAATGGYGPLTFRAVNALKARQSRPQDGILTPADRKALAEAAAQARAALRFEIVTDARTGARIGLPLGLLTKSEAVPNGGTRWQSADGRITVDSRIGLATDTLPALFEKISATTPTRTVSYKLLRPDFYVVSGETAGGKFYSRMAANLPTPASSSSPLTLRGFSIGYDKALGPSFDKVVIAIANSYEPFPAVPQPAAPSVAASPTTTQPAAPKPAERFGTGLIVGRERVLVASATLAGCRTPVRVDGKPARLRATEEKAGLALFDVDGIDARALASGEASIQPGEALLIVAIGETAPGKRGPLVLPATATGDGGVLTPLQPDGAGAAVFDTHGRLRGLITANPSERYLVAGVAPPRSYAMAEIGGINALLGQAGIGLGSSAATPPLSTGAVAERGAQAIVGLSCGM
jgi:hypothetical protein